MTVTFLGASLGGVGALAALAARWTGEAVLRQEGVRQAASVVDSLLGAPLVADGERRARGVVVQWTARPSGDRLDLVVTATGPAGEELVRLDAPWFPPASVLPWPEQVDP